MERERESERARERESERERKYNNNKYTYYMLPKEYIYAKRNKRWCNESLWKNNE
jgi:hypothetical protein